MVHMFFATPGQRRGCAHRQKPNFNMHVGPILRGDGLVPHPHLSKTTAFALVFPLHFRRTRADS